MFSEYSHLLQIFIESAESVTKAFSEVEVTVLLESKRVQYNAADILKAARAGEERVIEWKGNRFCDVDDFWKFLPRYYLDAYLSWDFELENHAAVKSIKQKLEENGIACCISQSERSKENCRRLTFRARTCVVLLTERYLRMLDEDTTTKVEFERVTQLLSHPIVIVAFEPEILGMELSEDLGRIVSESKSAQMLDFTTVDARESNYLRLLEVIEKASSN